MFELLTQVPHNEPSNGNHSKKFQLVGYSDRSQPLYYRGWNLPSVTASTKRERLGSSLVRGMSLCISVDLSDGSEGCCEFTIHESFGPEGVESEKTVNGHT